MSIAQILNILGGPEVLGPTEANLMAIVKLVRRGLPAKVIQFVLDSGRLSLAEIYQLVLPRGTLNERILRGTLTPRQSDRLLCVARIIALTEDTFGGTDKGAAWLRRSTAALDGERPLDLLDTFAGARVVETLLGRVAHGIAA